MFRSFNFYQNIINLKRSQQKHVSQNLIINEEELQIEFAIAAKYNILCPTDMKMAKFQK